MLVDNELETITQTKTYLEDKEFDLITFPSSKEAINFLEEQPDKTIDLILVNTYIPGSIHNGFYSINPKATMHSAEPDSFLEKPFTKDQLQSFIKKQIL